MGDSVPRTRLKRAVRAAVVSLALLLLGVATYRTVVSRCEARPGCWDYRAQRCASPESVACLNPFGLWVGKDWPNAGSIGNDCGQTRQCPAGLECMRGSSLVGRTYFTCELPCEERQGRFVPEPCPRPMVCGIVIDGPGNNRPHCHLWGDDWDRRYTQTR